MSINHHLCCKSYVSEDTPGLLLSVLSFANHQRENQEFSERITPIIKEVKLTTFVPPGCSYSIELVPMCPSFTVSVLSLSTGCPMFHTRELVLWCGERTKL